MRDERVVEKCFSKMSHRYRIVNVGILEVVIAGYLLDVVRVGLKGIRRKDG